MSELFTFWQVSKVVAYPKKYGVWTAMLWVCKYLVPRQFYHVLIGVNTAAQVMLETYRYRTRAIITRGFYYFPILLHVGFSLMIGGIPLK